jgi:hypothetical protein
MKLSEQIKYCIQHGFDVSFISNGLMLEIKVERRGVEYQTMLPSNYDHMSDERMSEAVKYCLDKVWEELYPVK